MRVLNEDLSSSAAGSTTANGNFAAGFEGSRACFTVKRTLGRPCRTAPMTSAFPYGRRYAWPVVSNGSTRSSHSLAVCWPLPSTVAVPLPATRYPEAIALASSMRLGSTRTVALRVCAASARGFSRWVMSSASDSSVKVPSILRVGMVESTMTGARFALV